MHFILARMFRPHCLSSATMWAWLRGSRRQGSLTPRCCAPTRPPQAPASCTGPPGSLSHAHHQASRSLGLPACSVLGCAAPCTEAVSTCSSCLMDGILFMAATGTARPCHQCKLESQVREWALKWPEASRQQQRLPGSAAQSLPTLRNNIQPTMLGPPTYLPNGTAQLGHVQTPTDKKQAVLLCTSSQQATGGRAPAKHRRKQTNREHRTGRR